MRASLENWVCPTCGAVNNGRLCRIDGTRRDDPGRAERWVWQCPHCFGLNDHDDSWCHSCGEPELANFGATGRQIPWIIVVLVVGAAGLTGFTGLVFAPVIISIAAVAVLVGGIVALVRAPLARHAGHFETRSDPIVFLGLALWLVAQALPAFTLAPYFGDEPGLVWGIFATLIVSSLFFVVPGVSGLLLAVAWSANVWLALAALARWRWPELMAPLAALAGVACVVGLGILLAGGVPEPGGRITDIGAGSWLWMAGTLLVLVGAAVPVVGRLASRSSGAT